MNNVKLLLFYIQIAIHIPWNVTSDLLLASAGNSALESEGKRVN